MSKLIISRDQQVVRQVELGERRMTIGRHPDNDIVIANGAVSARHAAITRSGDQAMLEYTTIGNPLPSFGLIVHHTDADREYAYDAKPRSSGKLTTALVEAKERDWTVVDMKTDWKTVFPPAK